MNTSNLHKFATYTFMLAVVCLLSLVPINAQDESTLLSSTSIQLVDVPFSDGWVISVPEDWLIWKSADFETAEEASVALIELNEAVVPDFDSEGSDFTQYFDSVNFLIARPELLGDVLISLISFSNRTKSSLADSQGVSPEDIDATFLAEMVSTGTAANEIIELNGREALITVGVNAGQYVGYQIHIVPEDAAVDEVINATLILPLSHFTEPQIDQVVLALLMSIRMEGEPIDIEAWETLMEGRWEGQVLNYTDLFTLPTEDTDDTEDADNAEATDETEDDESATPTAAAAITCTVEPLQNVNMRAEPSTSATITGVFTEGTTAEAVAQTTDASGFVWFQLENDSWVRSDVVSASDEACLAELVDFS